MYRSICVYGCVYVSVLSISRNKKYLQNSQGAACGGGGVGVLLVVVFSWTITRSDRLIEYHISIKPI